MQRPKSIETAFTTSPQNIAEAMLLNRIAHVYLEDSALQAKTQRIMKDSVEREIAPFQAEFTDYEGAILMAGLKHVVAFDRENDYVVAAAQMFIDEHEHPEVRELNDMRVEDYEHHLIQQGVSPYASRLIGQRAIEAHTTFDELAGREMAAKQDFPTGAIEVFNTQVHNQAA